MTHTILVPIALFGWIPITVLMFLFLKPHRAILVSAILGFLFLPIYTYEIKGIPDFSKYYAVNLGILFGMIFRYTPDNKIRVNYIDILFFMWVCVNIVTSALNDLGLYDGFSSVKDNIIKWFVPYLAARLYFNTPEKMKELAIGIFLGGLIYVPFVIFELRMSPQLHNIFYGFHQHSFSQVIRGGAFRPMVFMEHGLQLSLWLALASLVGICLLKQKVIGKNFLGTAFHAFWYVAILVVVTVLCRSTGATILMIVGVGIYFAALLFRTRLLVLFTCLIPFAYVGLRWYEYFTKIASTQASTVGVLSDNFLVLILGVMGLVIIFTLITSLILVIESFQFKTVFLFLLLIPVLMGLGKIPEKIILEQINSYFGPERAQSLQFRFDNEKLLFDKAMKRPYFGWGGYGRSRIYDAFGKDISVTDGEWIIIVGTTGMVGLMLFLLAFLLPVMQFVNKYPVRQWNDPVPIYTIPLCFVVMLYMIDNLPNAMPNPLYTIVLGGIVSMNVFKLPKTQNSPQPVLPHFTPHPYRLM